MSDHVEIDGVDVTGLSAREAAAELARATGLEIQDPADENVLAAGAFPLDATLLWLGLDWQDWGAPGERLRSEYRTARKRALEAHPRWHDLRGLGLNPGEAPVTPGMIDIGYGSHLAGTKAGDEVVEVLKVMLAAIESGELGQTASGHIPPSSIAEWGRQPGAPVPSRLARLVGSAPPRERPDGQPSDLPPRLSQLIEGWRYFSRLYSDPRDWPKAPIGRHTNQVMDWFMKRGYAKESAKVIDRLLRPEVRRKGGRHPDDRELTSVT